MNLTLQHLATPEGVQYLADVTGGTRSFYNHPETAEQVQIVAQNAIDANPSLADIKVRVLPNLPNTFYNYDKGELYLGIVNPAALAHELEHANNLRQHVIYQKVLRAAQGVARVNNLVAVPTVLALRTFIKDRDRRDDILQTLSALSSAVAAPVISEETSASMGALSKSPDKVQAMKTLGPALLAHVLAHSTPSLVYRMGRS